MDQIVLVFGNTVVTASNLILALAALAAVCLFLGFGNSRKLPAGRTICSVLLATVLAFVCGRLLHWYSLPYSYSGFIQAITQYRAGGYSLLGAMVGCVLGVSLVFIRHPALPQALDCLALSGTAGIALGRMNYFFSAFDRGAVLDQFAFLASPTPSGFAGGVEYRFATFQAQSVIALLLFCFLLRLFRDSKKHRDGDLALLFLLLYGASQIVMDSTRYDALFLPINGFVSVEMIAALCAMIVAYVTFSVRLIRQNGFQKKLIAFWLGFAALAGGAGYMEYYAQRHGNQLLFAYSFMTLFLVLMSTLGLTLWRMQEAPAADSEAQ